jgi:orotate phosphoribosyltransferase
MDGHFKLSSGLHSARYMQCALVLQHPRHAEKLCAALAEKFKDDKITVVVGPAMGGVIAAQEVARALGARSIFAERENGKMALRRGFVTGKRDKVLIVEDVVTTGRSTKEVIEVIKGSGAEIIGIGSIVNRASASPFKEKFASLIDIDIPAFKPEACALCREGRPVVKPGSRA